MVSRNSLSLTGMTFTPRPGATPPLCIKAAGRVFAAEDWVCGCAACCRCKVASATFERAAMMALNLVSLPGDTLRPRPRLPFQFRLYLAACGLLQAPPQA